VTRTLYEKLITVDKVDLLMGPYATGAIIAAMGVAQRYQKVLIHHQLRDAAPGQVRDALPAAPFGPEPAAPCPASSSMPVGGDREPAKSVATSPASSRGPVPVVGRP